mgnify:CR=1 FL=1
MTIDELTERMDAIEYKIDQLKKEYSELLELYVEIKRYQRIAEDRAWRAIKL